MAAFEYWSEYLPCTDPDSMGAHDYNQHSSTPLILPDLYLFNSQHLPATSKQLLTRAFFTDERVWRCFRSLRFVDADHDPAEDQQPMGSNKQWLAVLHSPLFTEMRKSHDYMLWMEPDTQVRRTLVSPSPSCAQGCCCCYFSRSAPTGYGPSITLQPTILYHIGAKVTVGKAASPIRSGSSSACT